jgi:hypothetical protein
MEWQRRSSKGICGRSGAWKRRPHARPQSPPRRPQGGDKPHRRSLHVQGDRDGPTSHVILSAAKDLCARRVRPFPFAEFTLERSEGLRAAAHARRRDHRRHAAWRSRWSPWKTCLSECLWGQAPPLHFTYPPCRDMVMPLKAERYQWNCSASVEPARAVVEDMPPAMACATSSK